MSDICYPADTDWSCRFSPEQLADLMAIPAEAALIERAEAFAWSLLAAYTAYRIGTCPISVRPCAARCAPEGSYRVAIAGGGSSALPVGVIGRPWTPMLTGGTWVNVCGCRSANDCSCSAVSEVILPGPVGRIVSVSIDGAALPASAYRVDNGNRLVRQDGEQWPLCQDMSAPTPEFEVVYYRGAAPNVMTRAAAGQLASEFYASCKGEPCRLPGNLTSMNRQGESYQFDEVDIREGNTGIPEVNAVIRIYNPYGLKTAPTVTSPDAPMTRMRTA